MRFVNGWPLVRQRRQIGRRGRPPTVTAGSEIVRLSCSRESVSAPISECNRMATLDNTGTKTEPVLSTLDTAMAYARAGLCVIPIRADGSKRPSLSSWGSYQKVRPTEDAIRGWWSDGHHGIAIIGGMVSGNLECIDFDRGELYAQWCELVEARRRSRGTAVRREDSARTRAITSVTAALP